VNIFRKLTEKPWLAEQVKLDDLHQGGEFALPTVKIGLRVFLATITVVFSLVVVIYVGRMTYGDWHPLSEPWLLWPNTAMLILSSIALQWAVFAAQRGESDGVRTGLLAGGVFAIAFLIGQLLVWQRLEETGYLAAGNPANAFFYLIIAAHGAHMLGGLVAWGRTMAKVWRGFEVAKLRMSVELCATYWHFLLVVWLVLFALLLFT
jgi:cytochrome c oxidase subunit 3